MGTKIYLRKRESLELISKNRLQNSDYFDSYENPQWKPETRFQKLKNYLWRFVFFISGPKFILSTLGLSSQISIHREKMK